MKRHLTVIPYSNPLTVRLYPHHIVTILLQAHLLLCKLHRLQCEALPRVPIKAGKRNAFFAIRRYPSNGNYSFICGSGPHIKQKNRHLRALEVLFDFAYETNAPQSFLIISFHKRGLRIVIGYANEYRGNVTLLTVFLCRFRAHTLGHR